MSEELHIPQEHWQPYGSSETWALKTWENNLRRHVREEPDPAKRFDKWLTAKAKGEGTYGVRLVFIEQPYLGWAEKVEKALAEEEKSLRESIAYFVTHPDED